MDFDGVIHSYTSRWQGPEIISDPPVPGAFKFIEDLIQEGFRVAIFSARNSKQNAPAAMIQWFMDHGMPIPVIEHLEFPQHKPSAEIYIDDRGYHFTGTFPPIEYIKNFRTWNRP